MKIIILLLQKFVEILLKYGVEISSKEGPKESDNEAEAGEGKDMKENLVDVEFLLKNRNVLDMLLREVTLCDSLHNSSSFNTDRFSWTEEDEQEEGNFLIDLLKEVDRSMKLVEEEEGEKEGKMKNDHNNEQNIQRKRLLERKQRYLRMKKAMNKKKDDEKKDNMNTQGNEGK